MKTRLISLVALLFPILANSASPADGPCSSNVMNVPFVSTISPGVLNNLQSFYPLGNIFGVHVMPTAHFYLDLVRTTPNDFSTPSVATTILAPGSIKIISVSKHLDSHTPGTTITAYKLNFKVCNSTYFYIDHINTLASDIDNVVKSTLASCSNCSWYNLVNTIDLNSGDKLESSISTHSLDIGAYDINFAAAYITPSHFEPDYAAMSAGTPNSVADLKALYPSISYKKCALDYFDKASVKAILGYSTRTAAPLCGDFAQDIAGRATGTWLPISWSYPVAGGVGNGNEMQTLNLSHDSINPTLLAFSIGDNIPLTDAAGVNVTGTLPSNDYHFDNYSAPTSIWDFENWRFQDIPVGNEVYCYRNLRNTPWAGSLVANRIILLQMRLQLVNGVSKNVLRIQAREATTCPPVSHRNMNGGGLTGEFLRD